MTGANQWQAPVREGASSAAAAARLSTPAVQTASHTSAGPAAAPTHTTNTGAQVLVLDDSDPPAEAAVAAPSPLATGGQGSGVPSWTATGAAAPETFDELEQQASAAVVPLPEVEALQDLSTQLLVHRLPALAKALSEGQADPASLDNAQAVAALSWTHVRKFTDAMEAAAALRPSGVERREEVQAALEAACAARRRVLRTLTKALDWATAPLNLRLLRLLLRLGSTLCIHSPEDAAPAAPVRPGSASRGKRVLTSAAAASVPGVEAALELGCRCCFTLSQQAESDEGLRAEGVVAELGRLLASGLEPGGHASSLPSAPAVPTLPAGPSRSPMRPGRELRVAPSPPRAGSGRRSGSGSGTAAPAGPWPPFSMNRLACPPGALVFATGALKIAASSPATADAMAEDGAVGVLAGLTAAAGALVRSAASKAARQRSGRRQAPAGEAPAPNVHGSGVADSVAVLPPFIERCGGASAAVRRLCQALEQTTHALRHLAASKKRFPYFWKAHATEATLSLFPRMRKNKGIALNVCRLLSKLSLAEQCRRRFRVDPELLDRLAGVLVAHAPTVPASAPASTPANGSVLVRRPSTGPAARPPKAPGAGSAAAPAAPAPASATAGASQSGSGGSPALLVRCLFVLGNLTARADAERERLVGAEGLAGALCSTVRYYARVLQQSAATGGRPEEAGAAVPDRAGTDKEDVLVKGLRLVANLAISAGPGEALVRLPAATSVVDVLQALPPMACLELRLNATAAATNLLFHAANLDSKAPAAAASQLLEPRRAATLAARLSRQVLLLSMPALQLESARAIANLGRSPSTCPVLIEAGVVDALVTALSAALETLDAHSRAMAMAEEAGQGSGEQQQPAIDGLLAPRDADDRAKLALTCAGSLMNIGCSSVGRQEVADSVVAGSSSATSGPSVLADALEWGYWHGRNDVASTACKALCNLLPAEARIAPTDAAQEGPVPGLSSDEALRVLEVTGELLAEEKDRSSGADGRLECDAGMAEVAGMLRRRTQVQIDRGEFRDDDDENE